MCAMPSFSRARPLQCHQGYLLFYQHVCLRNLRRLKHHLWPRRCCRRNPVKRQQDCPLLSLPSFQLRCLHLRQVYPRYNPREYRRSCRRVSHQVYPRSFQRGCRLRIHHSHPHQFQAFSPRGSQPLVHPHCRLLCLPLFRHHCRRPRRVFRH